VSCEVTISSTLYTAEAYSQDDVIAQDVDYVSSMGVLFNAGAENNENFSSCVKNT
jgi:hypothetical protein